MTSRTGNRSGFTLIEVMAAAVILTLGAVYIFTSLFSTISAIDYYHDSLYLIPWMDEELWSGRNAIERAGDLGDIDRSGKILLGGRPASWMLTSSLEDTSNDASLYRLELDVGWQRGSRTLQVKRTAYALYRQNRKE